MNNDKKDIQPSSSNYLIVFTIRFEINSPNFLKIVSVAILNCLLYVGCSSVRSMPAQLPQ